ncbi:MAG TPA: imidazole glycerol phosphate synthase subunit HisF [Saprospiraceae bacterium]|nr:imidazole glycerol phosphate synthase subunit HisF [Saprospiraceae bacterium]
MLKKRIVPCLDIKNGRTVKGINFVNLRDAGDPVELAAVYSDHGADELVFLDISASQENRGTLVDLVKRISERINIPFSVGGGISHAGAVYNILQNGADKVSVNSSAVRQPDLISDIAQRFGSQCCIVAIDARWDRNQWIVYTHGGKKPVERELFSWALEAQERGAGEILFTSMDHDGTRNGFAVEALSILNKKLTIPVIASGGAGKREHFLEVFNKGNSDAALAASIFHFGEIAIPELKEYLNNNGVPVRRV